MAKPMQDGIRRVRSAKESKRKGRDVYAYKVPYRDANGKQTSETFQTLEEARDFKARLRSKNADGVSVDPKTGRMSVQSYGEEWLTTKKATKRERTVAVYTNLLRTHVFPTLGGKYMNAVTQRDIQRLVTSLYEGPLSARSVRLVHRTMAAMFRTSVVAGLRASSPCVGIELPTVVGKEVSPLDMKQVWALATNIDARYRALVLLAAGTGLRVAECLGLTWDRIDLEGQTATVDRQITRYGCLAVPKSQASRRVVPLPDMAVQALKEHKRSHPPQTRIMIGANGKSEDVELVFTSARERVLTQDTIRPPFRRACDRAGLSRSVTFHTLRHTYASLLIDAGESPKLVQTRMGHSTISITMDVYGHLFPNAGLRTRSAIDTAFSDNKRSESNSDARGRDSGEDDGPDATGVAA